MHKDNLLKEATLIKDADKVIKANKIVQKQYLYLIEKLVGEEKMAEAMKSLIKNADDLMAAITIANGLQ